MTGFTNRRFGAKRLRFFTFVPAAVLATAMGLHGQIVLENQRFKLELGVHGQVKSLVHKRTGQECLAGVVQPAFSVLQYRPYDNENQLTYVTRPTVFPADTLWKVGDTLFVGFARLDYIARIRAKPKGDYIAFRLEGFWKRQKKLGVDLETRIDETVFLQLPVRNRRHFGEWLNVAWDEQVAVALLGTNVYTRIDDEGHRGYHLMRAGSVREVRLTGVEAALVVCSTDSLLKCIDRVEQDYNLPRGVASRLHPSYRSSYYECRNLTPATVSQHIQYARLAGMRIMVMYYTDFAKSMGHFPWKREYPNGFADLRNIARKVQKAGLVFGFHIHYNKAQITDPYVTPVPDPRLNIRRMFTLVADVNDTAQTLTVEENPTGVTLHEGRRLLLLDREIVEYGSIRTDGPYQFMNCKRGALGTRRAEHLGGSKIGLLDVDNWPIFIRFDQRTSIQDEVAARLQQFVQAAGFRFLYFDGAEDVNRPFWFNVPYAQVRVYKKLQPKPFFSEGACKTHFNWHILSRGNAFDPFAPEEIEQAVDRRFLPAARYNAENFTTVNFGWMTLTPPGEGTVGLQPDMVEYVASHAAAFDCPLSILGELDKFAAHPRAMDDLEVLRRWEEVKRRGLLTQEQKMELRKPGRRFTLLVDKRGKFELYPCRRVEGVAGGDARVRALVFSRQDQTWAWVWDTRGADSLRIGVDPKRVGLYVEGGGQVPFRRCDEGIVIPIGPRRILAFDLSEREVERILCSAEFIERCVSHDKGG